MCVLCGCPCVQLRVFVGMYVRVSSRSTSHSRRRGRCSVRPSVALRPPAAAGVPSTPTHTALLPLPNHPTPNTKRPPYGTPTRTHRARAGQRWKEVRHDTTVTWLAFWRDPVNSKEYKYVFLAATSTWKSESDLQK